MDSPWAGKAIGGMAHELDEVEAQRALALFADPTPGNAVHFQAKPSWKTRLVPGNDAEAMMAAVRSLNAGDSIYFGLNPVSANLFLGSKDVKALDIQCRKLLCVDIDRAKTNEDKKLSATEAEKEAARSVADAVRDYLDGLGWAAPAITDTGNGFALVYRIELPADKLSQAILRKCLHTLAARFDKDGVTVDRSMHNADRIIKLPGSWACKGPDTSDRPHRQCRILFAPDVLRVVTVEQIQAVSGPVSVSTDTPVSGTLWNGIATTAANGRAAYSRAALERECGRMACTSPGELNAQAYRSAAALGELVGAGMLTEDEVFRSLLAALRTAGGDDPHKDEDVIRRGIEKGKTQPRQLPERNGTHGTSGPKIAPGERVTYRASTVTPRKVEFLWPGRIPLGKLTTFAGVGGLGKTFTLLDMAARVTRGGEWPGSGGECAKAGQVLFISGEDDPDDTLVPRLIELGADLDRVSFLRSEVQDRFTLADLGTLDQALEEMGKETRFVAIDPPAAFLGDKDDHRNAEVRSLLSPLKTWSAKHQLATVFNTHFTKSGGAKIEAMERVMASVAWVNAVRSAFAFARDPEDRERVLFIPMKMNIAKVPPGLAYRIVVKGDLATIEWLGEVDMSADDAVNKTSGPKRRRVVASKWLALLFAEVDELPSKTIWDAKKSDTTLSDDALKEAKEMMRIRARQQVDTDGVRCWFWFWTSADRAWWTAQNKPSEEKAEGQDAYSP